jgi:hypothetical protein
MSRFDEIVQRSINENPEYELGFVRGDPEKVREVMDRFMNTFHIGDSTLRRPLIVTQEARVSTFCDYYLELHPQYNSSMDALAGSLGLSTTRIDSVLPHIDHANEVCNNVPLRELSFDGRIRSAYNSGVVVDFENNLITVRFNPK